MSLSNKKQGMIFAFDSFCKKVMRNEVRDFYNELKRARNRETLFTDLTLGEYAQLYTYDKYFNYEQLFVVLDYAVVISDELVAAALAEMPKQKRNILLLFYYVKLNDRQIGEKLSLIRATVQYKRKTALKEMKKIIERNLLNEQQA